MTNEYKRKRAPLRKRKNNLANAFSWMLQMQDDDHDHPRLSSHFTSNTASIADLENSTNISDLADSTTSTPLSNPSFALGVLTVGFGKLWSADSAAPVSTDRYFLDEAKLVGRGAFAQVFSGLDTWTGRAVAIKRYLRQYSSTVGLYVRTLTYPSSITIASSILSIDGVCRR